ncbi:CpsD/CapB family tyrosine-protein kinase [Lederbergia wuyishanensis]|uniref:non-specific protein-tyrosine kinase n=1 Tax=Lederbergia wuyishanensis TaxID=1347903 RepID=A0ABU0D7Q2_9BACI|nr:CpsD/CapB family tyrosine-protein kinase [Lederbergia wuyishanensis]MCJ8009114.1 CpsD/CapB family tyrosine-protein kinase [Lederbergia wuyishanensis]MDQ0344453.1 capsular exopolysaccharide synthesis family protein [Lederbergia wuyishanensis]
MVLNKRKRSKSNKRRNLIAFSSPDSIISEQYRMIRTNIHFLIGDKTNNTLLITSPGKNEGKSTTTANLAISMAQQKEKVLLIDGNFRDPSIHNIFKVPNTLGLTDILTDKATFQEAVNISVIDGLDVLTSGSIPTNPVELLASQTMKSFLKNINSFYDFILIDSTSLLEVTDTKIIANISDGVILVVRQEKTNIESAFESKKVLEYAKAKIVGVILNEKR